MRTIASAVHRAVEGDNVALEALQEGVLNTTAYARKIQPSVRKWVWKDVQVGAIVVALRRYAKEKKKKLVPKVKISDTIIQTGIRELIFENTSSVQQQIGELGSDQKRKNRFYVCMQGLEEINVLMKMSEKFILTSEMKRALKKELTDLVAVTAKLEEGSIEEANTFYALMKPLIAKQINIIEILTGLSEITLVIEKKDQTEVVACLESF